ncbi:MAG: hypothetical protein H7287_08940 [Thermoleophilia bacterium]|nr:hypothetical protein [Thermoleophilia bacterium]
MSATVDRIAETLADARSARVTEQEALRSLADLGEARSGHASRRADGAFFTADDVAAWLTRRAITTHLLEAAGAELGELDSALADGRDLHRVLRIGATGAAARSAMRHRLASLVVCDPTCGAGAFLIAAWRELVHLEALLDGAARATGGDDLEQPRIRAQQLTGLDLDVDAVAACRAGLELVTRSTTADIRCGDALMPHPDDMAAADVLVGNPPYVRAAPGSCPSDLTSARAGNLAAFIVERALLAAAPGARCAFVLPVAAACSAQWGELRAQWGRRCRAVFASHFDTIPATLFPGVVQRLTILEGCVERPNTVDTGAARWFTTRYHRWKRAERAGLLDRVRFLPLPEVSLVPGSIAKVGEPVEAALLTRLAAHPPMRRLFAAASDADPNQRIHYKRRWSYFLLFADFVPPVWNADGTEREPTECKALDVAPGVDPRVLLATYSSSLFWWYFSAFTDNRNVNRRELEGFPLPELTADQLHELAQLGGELMSALRACSEVRTCTYRSIGTIRNTYFRQGATRPVLDRIDAALARAYGMSSEELDFVLAFERRFRS